MQIQEVIDRAIADPEFAAELFVKASKASRELEAKSGGLLSAEPPGESFRDLLEVFADGPEELGRLTFDAKTAEMSPGTLTTGTTITTMGTITSLPCTVTSTTTTTTTTFTTI